MADTERTLAALLALFADNTTGNISPQDLRDFVVSAVVAHGSLYVSTPAVTTIGVAGTYVKAAGTTTARAGLYNFDMPTDNRLRYTGTVTRHVKADITLTFTTTAGTSQVIAGRVALNGTPDATTTNKNDIKAVGDYKVLTLQWTGEMSTNDYLELWITNETGANNVQVETMQIFASALFNNV